MENENLELALKLKNENKRNWWPLVFDYVEENFRKVIPIHVIIDILNKKGFNDITAVKWYHAHDNHKKKSKKTQTTEPPKSVSKIAQKEETANPNEPEKKQKSIKDMTDEECRTFLYGNPKESPRGMISVAELIRLQNEKNK